MGQNRRGRSFENSGDRIGRESCKLNLDYGLGQHIAQEGVEKYERGLDVVIRPGIGSSDNLVGFLGGYSGSGGGT